jgi:phage gpG-like protein
MSPKEFNHKLTTLEAEFKEFFNKTAPTIAGEVAVRLFKQNFQDEGFFGEKWLEVKRRIAGTKAYRAAEKHHPTDHTRRILTGRTGDLGRSIEVKSAGDGRAVVWTNPAAFTSKEPYGRVHNEGLRAGRGSGFTMPRRQFIGDHAKLRAAITDELQKKLSEIIKMHNS